MLPVACAAAHLPACRSLLSHQLCFTHAQCIAPPPCSLQLGPERHSAGGAKGCGRAARCRSLAGEAGELGCSRGGKALIAQLPACRALHASLHNPPAQPACTATLSPLPSCPQDPPLQDNGSEHPHRVCISARADVTPAMVADLEQGARMRGLQVGHGLSWCLCWMLGRVKAANSSALRQQVGRRRGSSHACLIRLDQLCWAPSGRCPICHLTGCPPHPPLPCPPGQGDCERHRRLAVRGRHLLPRRQAGEARRRHQRLPKCVLP